MRATVKHFLATFINALFPPSCMACDNLVGTVGSLCPSCWDTIHFISAPHCDICGHPFEYEEGETLLCAECIAHAPPYRRARAVFRYTEASRKLVTHFKYYDKTHSAPYLASWMVRAGSALLEEADMVVPVPLHRFRLFKRRYNQSALLCYAISKHTSVPTVVSLLLRTRNTPPQADLTRPQRRRNVAGAFTINPRYREAVKGKRVLLVDDVITTGATIHACTRALKKAGAKHVEVLTLARTVRG